MIACYYWANILIIKDCTKVIVFGTRRINLFNFKLSDKPIKITTKYHYLGVIFSNNGSFLHVRKHVAEQGNTAMHYWLIKIIQIFLLISY